MSVPSNVGRYQMATDSATRAHLLLSTLPLVWAARHERRHEHIDYKEHGKY